MKQIKLEKNELSQLNNIKNAKLSIVNEFGKISIIELQLSQRKNNAEINFAKIEEAQVDLAKNLEEKYGKGTIDIDSGVFIPLK
tara:strand:- start:1176 stop:1427 length:252 start_codon:yes stop_codon:yes gene_type:complete